MPRKAAPPRKPLPEEEAPTTPRMPGGPPAKRRERASVGNAPVWRGQAMLYASVLLLALVGAGGTGLALSLGRHGTAGQRSLLLVGQLLLSLLCVGVIFRQVARDWRQRQKQEAQLQNWNQGLQEQAQTDGLTGVKNRRAFEQRLQEEWARARRYGHGLSLLLIDVDHFKRFNDNWGHLAGDETLRQTASLLTLQSRTSDFVARYGGEEFAILLPHTGETAALLTADRIRAAFRRGTWPHEAVTVSIGVATMSQEMTDLPDLIHAADVALYWAKHRGRDRAVAASTT